MPTQPPATSSLLGDDPRDGSTERPDVLNRRSFVGYLGQLIESVKEQSESSVMALIGEWGSGKTSILEMLRKELANGGSKAWLLADFNPWSYPDPSSLQHGFFTELIEALPKEGRPSGARQRIGDLARSISPLGKLAGIVGVDAEGAIQLAAKLITGDTSVSAAKQAAEIALRRLKFPVLMVIDDLDRLTPDELLDVLKLVRLVGRLPHVYYLLSYDERTLLDVLQRTAIAGNDEGRARAYLEKIVQVRVDMPALRRAQRTSLLETGLSSILGSNQISLTEADRQRLDQAYWNVLDRRLSTPRAITRFLGQVQAFYPPLRGEVDFVDFFLMSWLRTQEPGVYAMIQRERDSVLGRDLTEWHFGRRDAAAAEERHGLWQARLADAHVEAAHLDGVKSILSALFPELQAAFVSAHSYLVANESTRHRAVANPDYFDRYVSFGVTEDDLPDSVVGQALEEIAEGSEGPALGRLFDALRRDTGLTIRKIDALRLSGAVLPESALFALLARAWLILPLESTGIFDDPRRLIERAASQCLMEISGELAASTASSAAEQPGLAMFVVNVVRGLQRAKRSPYASATESSRDITPLVRVAIESLERAQERQPATSPFESGAMGIFWSWWELDLEGAGAWLLGQVDSGAWTLTDTIGALTSVATVFGTTGQRTGLGDFHPEVVRDVFGLDRVFGELSTQLDAATPITGDPLRISPTPEHRTKFALYELRRARIQQESAQTQPSLDSSDDPVDSPREQRLE